MKEKSFDNDKYIQLGGDPIKDLETHKLNLKMDIPDNFNQIDVEDDPSLKKYFEDEPFFMDRYHLMNFFV